MAGRIYTRRGDTGETSLTDGTRVPKDAARVEAYGAVDEANAWVGAARSFTGDALLDRALGFVQHRLFNCSSNLAMPPGGALAPPRVTDDDVAFLEKAIDRFEVTTGKLSAFILYGGSPTSGLLQIARTVCRRAERRLVTLAASETVDPLVLKFVNRASDFLFAAGRYANHVEGQADVKWEKDLEAPEI
jgi:cob(I)alamin adenosyltransferase